MTLKVVEAEPGDHAGWMTLALELATRGLTTTPPNPAVGSVVVSPQGQRLGEGFHQRAGEAHAEVLALAEAGPRARGATVYVTLEPCSHHGRTAPCADALIRAQVARVVYAMEDPNPKVAGAGLQRLREAGIEVIGPVLADRAAALNPGFISRMQRGRPWFTVKLAMSLDGRTAMAGGESQWITGPAARAEVQALRARASAVVTGVATVRADDPALTVRDPRFGQDPRQPLRVVVDSGARSSPAAKVFGAPGRAVLAALKDPEDGRTVWTLPAAGSGVSLPALAQALALAECNEVLVEAGPTLAGAFVAAGLADELQIFMAPKLMGNSARPLLDLAVAQLSAAPALDILEVRAVPPDWLIRARPMPLEA